MATNTKRVAILGLGLIGSSIARALSKKKLADYIAAFNHSPDALEFALKAGFIHSGHLNAADAVADADLIILATPPHAFAQLAQDIAPHLKPGAIVTDVASVKQSAIAAIKPNLPPHAHYVPAHPIAGSEKTGVEAGSSELFSSKKVILTPEETELVGVPVQFVRTFWEKIGAKVEFMPAFLHDQIYAYVSHLPQLVAFAVAPQIEPTLTDEKYVRFTRLMKSDPQLWADICLENAEYISNAIDDFISFATQIYGELKENPQADSKPADTQEPILFAGLIAACLIATASLLQEYAGVNPIRYAGTGFTDMTAASVADPQELLERISGNNTHIVSTLGKTLERLQRFRAVLADQNQQELAKLFSAR